MAEISKVNLIRNDVVAVPATVAIDATDGATLDYSAADHKIVVLFTNSGAEDTVTVTAGDAVQGVNDLPVTVPAGESAMVLESGWFLHVQGDLKQKVKITGPATVSATMLVLP